MRDSADQWGRLLASVYVTKRICVQCSACLADPKAPSMPYAKPPAGNMMNDKLKQHPCRVVQASEAPLTAFHAAGTVLQCESLLKALYGVQASLATHPAQWTPPVTSTLPVRPCRLASCPPPATPLSMRPRTCRRQAITCSSLQASSLPGALGAVTAAVQYCWCFSSIQNTIGTLKCSQLVTMPMSSSGWTAHDLSCLGVGHVLGMLASRSLQECRLLAV